jgi:hypothetical protein
MNELAPTEIKEILQTIANANLDLVIVGGQAINLWAYRYYGQIERLSNYLPFASENLDFYGGKLEALLCSELLNGKVAIDTDFDRAPLASAPKLLIRTR